ncbi:hypothetical protein J4760_08105 [Salinicoccus sp. ID82-1]|uniref:hypothetical protein n=1 Tax=Salinicoccus sp. ID82-1 TaxID=2820269 RepID=UPI001F325A21|nr:hypothetical protein [Salinicoccus sp. ID82-1]MCG1009980.1 hypothetical protein [Salinicoccus sp. ID82-1]
MNRLIRTEDLEYRTVEYALDANSADSLAADIKEVFRRYDPPHLTIDITALAPHHRADMDHFVSSDYRHRCAIFIPAEEMDRIQFEKLDWVSKVEPEGDGFLFHLAGARASDPVETFAILKRNFSLKQKSYEMEIIESLIGESNRERQKYELLQSRYENLKAARMGGRDMDLEKRYVELMEKYKQSLQRLEKLRQSKLGRLQMFYWRQRRRR